MTGHHLRTCCSTPISAVQPPSTRERSRASRVAWGGNSLVGGIRRRTFYNASPPDSSLARLGCQRHTCPSLHVASTDAQASERAPSPPSGETGPHARLHNTLAGVLHVVLHSPSAPRTRDDPGGRGRLRFRPVTPQQPSMRGKTKHDQRPTPQASAHALNTCTAPQYITCVMQWHPRQTRNATLSRSVP